MFDIIF